MRQNAECQSLKLTGEVFNDSRRFHHSAFSPRRPHHGVLTTRRTHHPAVSPLGCFTTRLIHHPADSPLFQKKSYLSNLIFDAKHAKGIKKIKGSETKIFKEIEDKLPLFSMIRQVYAWGSGIFSKQIIITCKQQH